MLTAIIQRPSPRIADCELTYLPTQTIDNYNAIDQHRSYEDMLRGCGVAVMAMEANLHLPDSVFVEDTAVVLDELAIMTPMGVASRQAESEIVAATLQHHRPLAWIAPPARIEGGDVLRIGHYLFTGRSTRTNTAGIEALKTCVQSYGYSVIAVDVSGCLHLKTGCTALDEETVLINPDWVDPAPFKAFDRLSVPPEEPFGANILKIGDVICVHAGFERTKERIARRDYRTSVTDVSEFLKAEAGLTCMSLIFESNGS